ncbi:MAG TPA: hypothetical protein VE089_08125 [Nitrososphaeraceae archaeon]|jgi:hypothetical protein|nr:hypothetical protein [Nitrososphaeraceae archaeon]
MGRTIPSFRIASIEEEKDGRNFAKAWISKTERFLMICFQLEVYTIQLAHMLASPKEYNRFSCL